MRVDESPFITVLCRKCHLHYPLREAKHHVQNCTHVETIEGTYHAHMLQSVINLIDEQVKLNY